MVYLKQEICWEHVSSSSYGYFGGGLDPSSPPPQKSVIERLDFSNETISDVGDLPLARQALAATQSISHGYFGGGGNT